MDYLPALAHLAAIHLLMAMIPGPNTIAVGYCAAGISRRAGLKVAAGVSLASLIWVSFSLAGIGILLIEAGSLYRALRLAGAAYLLYVSFKLLRAALRRPEAQAAAPVRVYRSPFIAGVVTTLSNPKSAIFWTSVFAVVVPAHAPVWFYGAVLGLIGIQSLGWYGSVALMFSSRVSRRYYAKLTRALSGLGGLAMGIFGLKIANDLRLEAIAIQD